MNELILVAIAGFAASLVDGALGMGFGPTSSSIMLTTGLSPAAVSTTVNLAKVATGLASAVSHWRFENIDHRLVVRLAIPGCVGALLGVTVLSKIPGNQLKPILAALFVLVALRILWRFSRLAPRAADATAADDAATLVNAEGPGVPVAATVGGVTNGLIGAWGPIVTPYLVHRGVAPRYTIGSVNTAEVAVAAMSAGSLVAALGAGSVDVGVVLAMLAGGVLAAPVAAWLTRHVPARPMGLAVAALLLTTSARELSDWATLGPARWIAYGTVVVAVGTAALLPRLLAGRPTPAADATL